MISQASLQGYISYRKLNTDIGGRMFYILQKILLLEVAHFSKICYNTKFKNRVLSDASIAPTSEVLTAAMFVLFIENKKFKDEMTVCGMEVSFR
jgi:hypothetical protein